jgi:hypothetical protein
MDTPSSGAEDPGEGESTLPPSPPREDPAPTEPEPVWAPSTWRGESEDPDRLTWPPREMAAQAAARADEPAGDAAAEPSEEAGEAGEAGEPDTTATAVLPVTAADPFDALAGPPGGLPPEDTDAPTGSGGGRSRGAARFVAVVVVIGLLVAAGLAMAQDNDDEGDTAASPSTTEVAPSSTAATVKHSTTTTASTTTSSTSTSTTVAATTSTTATRGTGVATRPARRSRYGDDPTLDALYNRCTAGDFEGCDDLYRQSDSGTEYEQYGDTCGGRNAPGPFCVDLYGSGTRTGGAGTPNTYGDDIRLDSLYNGCRAGDMGACDRLYAESASGTEYEHFAATCGNRNDPAGSCVALYS